MNEPRNAAYYGAITASHEMTAPPPLPLKDDDKSIILYTDAENKSSEEGKSLNSSSNELVNFYPCDLLQIQDVFGENFLSETPAEVAVEKDIHELMVKKEKKVASHRVETINQGHSQRPNVFRSQENVRHNRMMASQPYLGRDCHSTRVGANNAQVKGEVRSYTQIIYSSQNHTRGMQPHSSTTQMKTRQRGDCKLQRIQRSVQSTSMSRPGFHRVEEANTSDWHTQTEPKFGYQPKPPETRYFNPSENSSPTGSWSAANVIHLEGHYFLANVSCVVCKAKKEYRLHKPGHWPSKQCHRCGEQTVINRWGDFTVDTDDDIVCLGEFVPDPKAIANNLAFNPTYNLKRVKTEQVDEVIRTPACQRCGGHHIRLNGEPQDFCPHYGHNENPNWTWI